MPRPRKKGLDYFPFDVDFFQDERVVAIAGEFGLKGEITIIKLLCAVYRNGYFAEWTEMLKYKLLSMLPGVSADLLDQIVNRLVKWGVFDKTLFDSAKVLTSARIQENYLDATRKRAPMPDLPYILSFRAENPRTTVVSAPKTPGFRRKNALNKSNYSSIINTTTPLPPKGGSGSGGCVVLDKESLGKEMKASDMWLEGICVSQKIEMPRLVGYIDKFLDDCTGRDNVPKTLKEAKSRFFGYILNRLENERNNNHAGYSRSGVRSKLPPPPSCGLIEDDG